MKTKVTFSEKVRNEAKAAYIAAEIKEVRGAAAIKAQNGLISAAAGLYEEAAAAGLNFDNAVIEAAAEFLAIIGEALKEEKAAASLEEVSEAAVYWTTNEAEAREALKKADNEETRRALAGNWVISAALRNWKIAKEEAAAKKEAREAAKAAKEAAKKAEAEASRAAEAKASRAAEAEAEAKRAAEAAAEVLKEAKKAAKASKTDEAKAAEAEAEAKEAEARRVLKEASEAAEAASEAAVNSYEGRRASNNIAKTIGRADERKIHEAAEYCRVIAAAFAAGAGNEYIIKAAAAYYADSNKLKRGEKETAAEYTARVMKAAVSAVANNAEIARRAAGLLCSKNQLFKLLRAYHLGIFEGNKFFFAKEVLTAQLADDIDEAKRAEKLANGWKYVIFQRGEDKYKLLASPSFAAILEDEEAASARRRQRVKKYEADAEGWKYYFKNGRLYTLAQYDFITLSDIYAAVSRRLQIEDARAEVLKVAKEAAAAAANNTAAASEAAKAALIAKIEETRGKLAVIFANCGGDIAKFKKASEEGRRVLRQQLAAAGLNEENEAYLIMCK